MRQTKIRADQLQAGQTVTSVPSGHVHRSRGQWPTVTAVKTEHGEDGPMVYLAPSDRRRAVFTLHSGELVTVAEAS